jgi:hypothetical protein
MKSGHGHLAHFPFAFSPSSTKPQIALFATCSLCCARIVHAFLRVLALFALGPVYLSVAGKRLTSGTFGTNVQIDMNAPFV